MDKGAMSLLRSLFSLDISIQNAGYIWKTVADEEQEAAGVRGADKVVGVNSVVVIVFGVEDAAAVHVISVQATSSDAATHMLVLQLILIQFPSLLSLLVLVKFC